jgi:hypothetical protein
MLTETANCQRLTGKWAAAASAGIEERGEVLPPDKKQKRKYRRIRFADRERISLLWNAEKLNRGQVAKIMGFGRAAINSELKRGFIQTADGEHPVYDAETAQRVAGERQRVRAVRISSGKVGKRRADGTRR